MSFFTLNINLAYFVYAISLVRVLNVHVFCIIQPLYVPLADKPNASSFFYSLSSFQLL